MSILTILARRTHLLARLACCLVVSAAVLRGPAVGAAAEEAIEFNRDVRPILADKCFACHGPDANKREADLRLDVQGEALADRGGYFAIVAGQPDQSELLRRVESSDPDERMPPAASGKSISERERGVLRRWIEQGAAWQAHWSLIPPRRADPPAVASDLVENEIDQFVWLRLEQVALQPAPVADRRTLIRRLSFDLVGLPPTAEEVDEFLADTSPQAYEKVVDRLLASQHYGERMAAYWLDVVRYADSGGYHSDNHRDVASYRDYVIRSFNNNLPFDQFTIEQIAGDLLPGATPQQRIASGYNRLLQTTEEGGAQSKEYTAKYQADRVRNTAAAWLGITLGCAECHDHKFDPFSMRDFYSFAAFFADIEERAVGRQQQVALPTPRQQAELQQLEQQLAPLHAELERSTPERAAAQAAWEERTLQQLASGQLDWHVLTPSALESAGGTVLTALEDASVLAGGANPDKETYLVTLQPEPGQLTALRLEALRHESLAGNKLSRGNGNFVLTGIEIELQGAAPPQPIVIAQALADFSQDGFPAALAIDGKVDTGWAVDGQNRAERREAVFVFAEPAQVAVGQTLLVRLRHESQHARHHIGRFRLAVTAAEQPGLGRGGLSAELVAALETDRPQRSDAQQAAIDRHYRSTAAELAPLREEIARLELEQQRIREAFPQTLVSVSVTPRTVRILPRGNWLDDSGEVVHPATPASLPQVDIPQRASARLELARWLVEHDNPLTARVFVNRLWKLLFGQGIVRTLDDFGTQGQWPSHPQLLDWLAVDFMESGWDVKGTIKQIVMSRTYQQSSRATPEQRSADPLNRWLARQSRFRLDAEVVRDNALAVSGLLSRRIGGVSVKPYQPAGYWQHLNFPKREWQAGQGEDLYRRGLYTYWQRTFLHPSLMAFDAPSREECTVERPRSNTPLQALVLLNDPTYVEAARALAARMLDKGGDSDAERLEFAFRQTLSRPPTQQESELLGQLHEQHLAQYQSDPESAQRTLEVGQYPLPSDVDRAELAAWTSVARVLLNLHETITRY